MLAVIERVGTKKMLIFDHDRIKAGSFLEPIKLGSASAWLDSDIQAWIEEQVRTAPR